MTFEEFVNRGKALIDRGTITPTSEISVIYEEMIFDDIEIEERYSNRSEIYLRVV